MIWLLIAWYIVGAAGTTLIALDEYEKGNSITAGMIMLYFFSSCFGPLVFAYIFFEKGVHMKVIVKGKNNERTK